MKKFKELQIRQVPEAALEAVRAESFVALEADLGRIEATNMLSFSVFAEYFEMVLLGLNRDRRSAAAGSDEKAFLIQEARHAAACHALNERILGPGGYRRDRILGRVPSLVDGSSLLGPDATQEQLWFMAAAVEAAFGVQSVVAMENAGDPRWLKHPGAYYVFLYHMAEEAEHSHVSWSTYEQTFGPIDTRGARFLAILDAYGRSAAALMCRLGDQLGAPIVSRDAIEIWGRVTAIGKTCAQSGDFDRFTDARRDCVRSWDETWEPRYRAACERLGKS